MVSCCEAVIPSSTYLFVGLLLWSVIRFYQCLYTDKVTNFNVFSPSSSLPLPPLSSSLPFLSTFPHFHLSSIFFIPIFIIDSYFFLSTSITFTSFHPPSPLYHHLHPLITLSPTSTPIHHLSLPVLFLPLSSALQPKIDPLQLLKCLSILLNTRGGIRGVAEVHRVKG